MTSKEIRSSGCTVDTHWHFGYHYQSATIPLGQSLGLPQKYPPLFPPKTGYHHTGQHTRTDHRTCLKGQKIASLFVLQFLERSLFTHSWAATAAKCPILGGPKARGVRITKTGIFPWGLEIVERSIRKSDLKNAGKAQKN